MAWDEDRKAKAVELYESKEPTPENTMEVVQEVAEELGESVNGVRQILSKAGVYVKKEATAGSGAAKSSGGSKRVSKAEMQEKLIAAIEDAGGEVDEEIISKLTGKAAEYLAGVINTASGSTGDS